MDSNPGQVELGVWSTSVLFELKPKLKWNYYIIHLSYKLIDMPNLTCFFANNNAKLQSENDQQLVWAKS